MAVVPPREHRPGQETSPWRPALLRADREQDRARISALIDAEGAAASSTIEAQLGELAECRDPTVKDDEAERGRRVAALLDGRTPDEYGCWVHFPWSRRLAQVLPEAEFHEVRASRNRYKITVEEQGRLRSCTVGVVGLSVGQAIATTMALEGCAGRYRLADFDTLALSNLNRLNCGVDDLGQNKAVIAARRLFEIDPYLEVSLWEQGVDEDSVDRFLGEGGRVDLLVEECDDLFMKVYLRERARALEVPVLMETNDRGMLDIERFDLEPGRELLHGLIGDVRARDLKGLPTKEKVPFILNILGDMSPRLAASLVEIDQTITSWPQLGSGAMLGGAVATDAARRILLGDLQTSGRFSVDIHQLVRDPDVPVEARSADAAPSPTTPAPASPSKSPSRAAAAGSLPEDTVRALVGAGLRAPSGGNCQPWRFAWSPAGRLRCLHDAARSESFLDFEHRAAYLALGAATENMVIAAAAAHGLETEVRPFPGADPVHVCDLEFRPRGGTPDERARRLAPAIVERATNRRLGPRSRLHRDEVAELRSVVADPDVELQVLTEDGELEEIGRILGAGDRVRFFDDRLYHEMMAEMRWSPEEARETADGIDIATLDLRDVDEAGLRLLSSWSVVRFLRSMGMGGALEDLSKRAVESASAVALLTVSGTGPLDYFRGGRATQRVWLAATAAGLAVQPMSSLPYMFARLDGGDGFEGRARAELVDLRGRYARLFDVSPATGELLLFRVARAEPPGTRSLRRPLEAVLDFE